MIDIILKLILFNKNMSTNFVKLKKLVADIEKRAYNLSAFGKDSGVTESEIIDEQNQVISACKKHAAENTPNKIGKCNVCVVHPYFLELEWDDFIAETLGIRRDAIPEKNLEKLLKNVNRSLFHTVLLENYRHYVLKSHELVDEGLMDKVIFTDGNRKEDFEDFTGSKENYIGGTVAHQCIKAAKKAIRGYAPLFSVRPLRDCISHHEPKFKYKVLAHLMLIFNPLLIANKKYMNDNGFHIPSRIYSQIRGVRSTGLYGCTAN